MSVLPSCAVILIGIGGFQPVASSFEMSAFSSGMIELAVAVAQRDDRRHVRLRVRVDRGSLPDGDSCIVCVPSSGVSDTAGPCRRARCDRSAGSTDPVPSRARWRRTRACASSRRSARSASPALAGRDLVLQFAGLQVVQVELSPVVALGVPDHFVRRPTGRANRCATRTASARFRRRPCGPRRSPCRRRAATRACGRATPTRVPASTPSGLQL